MDIFSNNLAKIRMKNQRRANALGEIENRNRRVQMKVQERILHSFNHRINTLQKKLRENVKRYKAYKVVLLENSFSNIPDYHSALDRDYSYHALRPKIMQTLQVIDPAYIREMRAKRNVERSRRQGEQIMQRSLNRLDTPRTRHAKEHKKELDRLTRMYQKKAGNLSDDEEDIFNDEPADVNQIQVNFPNTTTTKTSENTAGNELILPNKDVKSKQAVQLPALKDGMGFVTKPYYKRVASGKTEKKKGKASLVVGKKTLPPIKGISKPLPPIKAVP